MYKIITNPCIMTKAEIDVKYNGNWVYIVKANIDKHGTLLKGMPVVIGEFQFAGIDEDESIYSQFDGTEYGKKLSYTLLPNDDSIGSVFGVML